MTDQSIFDLPSPFIVEWATILSSELPRPGRALDVAMGRGRHAQALAALGFRTFGVDLHFDAVLNATRQAARQGLVVRGWCADLTMSSLPPGRFELVVVARYLQRDLFDRLREAVVPGGVVIYETFTVRQRTLGVGPRSPHHLLEPGELNARFDGFDILFCEEVAAPEAVARLVARKPRT